MAVGSGPSPPKAADRGGWVGRELWGPEWLDPQGPVSPHTRLDGEDGEDTRGPQQRREGSHCFPQTHTQPPLYPSESQNSFIWLTDAAYSHLFLTRPRVHTVPPDAQISDSRTASTGTWALGDSG